MNVLDFFKQVKESENELMKVLTHQEPLADQVLTEGYLKKLEIANGSSPYLSHSYRYQLDEPKKISLLDFFKNRMEVYTSYGSDINSFLYNSGYRGKYEALNILSINPLLNTQLFCEFEYSGKEDLSLKHFNNISYFGPHIGNNIDENSGIYLTPRMILNNYLYNAQTPFEIYQFMIRLLEDDIFIKYDKLSSCRSKFSFTDGSNLKRKQKNLLSIGESVSLRFLVKQLTKADFEMMTLPLFTKLCLKEVRGHLCV